MSALQSEPPPRYGLQLPHLKARPIFGETCLSACLFIRSKRLHGTKEIEHLSGLPNLICARFFTHSLPYPGESAVAGQPLSGVAPILLGHSGPVSPPVLFSEYKTASTAWGLLRGPKDDLIQVRDGGLEKGRWEERIWEAGSLKNSIRHILKSE